MASAATFPLVLILLIAGSALTTVFWSKWMGRILAVHPGRSGEGTGEQVFVRREACYVVSLGLLGLAIIAGSFAVMPVIHGLVAPALLWFYPAAFWPALGGNVILVSWAGFLHPNLAISGLPEGVFPLTLFLGGLAATALLPWILFKPASRSEDSVYLCGENTPDDENRRFVSAMEENMEMALAGYYFTGFVNDRLLRRLEWASGAGMLLMLGVIGSWILW